LGYLTAEMEAAEAWYSGSVYDDSCCQCGLSFALCEPFIFVVNSPAGRTLRQ
jgi:hypothetical protein